MGEAHERINTKIQTQDPKSGPTRDKHARTLVLELGPWIGFKI